MGMLIGLKWLVILRLVFLGEDITVPSRKTFLTTPPSASLPDKLAMGPRSPLNFLPPQPYKPPTITKSTSALPPLFAQTSLIYSTPNRNPSQEKPLITLSPPFGLGLCKKLEPLISA